MGCFRLNAKSTWRDVKVLVGWLGRSGDDEAYAEFAIASGKSL